jgi:hypothetical protein
LFIYFLSCCKACLFLLPFPIMQWLRNFHVYS